jgi:heme/copper-type cytochrome/quinol oxidase subunit 1
MPLLSRNFVRLSLIYLAVGFTLGALLLVNKGLHINPLIWNLLPLHAELQLMGWFVQLVVGVAYWILSRLSGEHPRGNPSLAWSSFWLINLGITLAILGSLAGYSPSVLVGRLLEFVGVLAIVTCSWKQVKTFAG